ncbi:MAG: DUF1289 domain-containing protein [Methylococcales bacterium]|nr:DUF1289 domain-containing protein [Methylococcales bacterium]MCK5924487.1 DUF1289 domain-containing protein [Methylococcales bacterium]
MAELESPCVRKCCLNENDICLGCFRSLTEITQWTSVNEGARKEFLKNSAKRRLQNNSNKW